MLSPVQWMQFLDRKPEILHTVCEAAQAHAQYFSVGDNRSAEKLVATMRKEFAGVLEMHKEELHRIVHQKTVQSNRSELELRTDLLTRFHQDFINYRMEAAAKVVAEFVPPAAPAADATQEEKAAYAKKLAEAKQAHEKASEQAKEQAGVEAHARAVELIKGFNTDWLLAGIKFIRLLA